MTTTIPKFPILYKTKNNKIYQWSIDIEKINDDLYRLNYYHGGYSYRIPDVGLKSDNAKVHANIQLPGLTIRYTVDGSEPGSGSTPYTGPVSDKGKLRFAAFDVSGRRGRIVGLENK